MDSSAKATTESWRLLQAPPVLHATALLLDSTLWGLVTFWTVFVIDLASRRVQVVGSTPHPDEVFRRQVGCSLTATDEGVLSGHRVLICDRDAKWSAPVRARLGEAGIRVVQTPFQAPNAKDYASYCTSLV